MKISKLLASLSALSIVGTVTIPLNSCKKPDNTCTITLDGGQHGWIRTNQIKVQKGKKWSEVKSTISDPDPDPEWTFDKWTLNGYSIDDSYVIQSNIVIIATYKSTSTACKITLNPGEHGTVTGTTYVVDKGSLWGDVKWGFKVTPNQGYTFKEWKLDGQSILDTYVINSDIEIVADYIEGQSCLITFLKGNGGTFDTKYLTVQQGTAWKDIEKPEVNVRNIVEPMVGDTIMHMVKKLKMTM